MGEEDEGVMGGRMASVGESAFAGGALEGTEMGRSLTVSSSRSDAVLYTELDAMLPPVV